MQGLEIKRLQRAPRPDFVSFVRHEKLAVDQVNISFDAAEAVVECVQERTFVFVVIVCVHTRQRHGLGVNLEPGAQEQQQHQKSCCKPPEKTECNSGAS